MSNTPSSYSQSAARSLAASPAGGSAFRAGASNGANGHVPTFNGSQSVASTHTSSGDGAGPSSPVNGYTDTLALPSVHNEQVIGYLYREGFQHGHFADTILHLGPKYFQLHAIILSQSPYLMHLLSTTPKQQGMNTIFVPLERFPEVTEHGFVTALGYLYSSTSLDNVSPSNARGVLAAACLLGGMDELCNLAYQQCRESITTETIQEWIEFVEGLPSSSDGTQTPSETVLRQTILGPYAAQLRADVLNFLVSTLPKLCGNNTEGRTAMLNVFARVPFEFFKFTIESPAFEIGADQERFRFAKEAIALRKRTRSGQPMETVVLAFDGSHSGSAVHVTRATKRRALFKVSGES